MILYDESGNLTIEATVDFSKDLTRKLFVGYKYTAVPFMCKALVSVVRLLEIEPFKGFESFLEHENTNRIKINETNCNFFILNLDYWFSFFST